MESNITHYRDHIGARPQKFYKTTLFRGDFLMLGLNCSVHLTNRLAGL